MNLDKLFEQIFLFYYGKVYSYAFRRLGSRWEAEEVAQGVFYKLWLHHEKIFSKHSFNTLADMNGYLFTMTKNAVADWARDNAGIAMVQEQVAEQIVQDLDLGTRMDLKRCLDVISKTVEQMPTVRRRVFVLSRYQNIPNEKIAAMLDISKRTVERHIYDALRCLRIELATQMV